MDLVRDDYSWRRDPVSTVRKANLFTTDGVLLVREGGVGEGGGIEKGRRGGLEVQVRRILEELDIKEAERVAGAVSC